MFSVEIFFIKAKDRAGRGGCIVVLVLALYRMFKSTEPLSFDNPTETDEVRRSRH